MFKFNLSSYLEKFKELKDPKDDKVIISQAIFEVTGMSVSRDDIVLRKNELFFGGSSLVKSRIFMMKGNILAKLEEVLPELKITEIR